MDLLPHLTGRVGLHCSARPVPGPGSDIIRRPYQEALTRVLPLTRYPVRVMCVTLRGVGPPMA